MSSDQVEELSRLEVENEMVVTGSGLVVVGSMIEL